MPDTPLNQIARIQPVDWFALALIISDTIEAPRTNTRTDQEALHHAASCYRRAEQYIRVMNNQRVLDQEPTA